jgi:hypothetical protein
VTLFNVADDTFIVADAGVLAALVADPVRTREWWPDLELKLTRDRGRLGREWLVEGSWSGIRWCGSMEIWLEPVLDGVIVHHYVRWDPVGEPLSASRVRRLAARYAHFWKRVVFSVKDEFEAGRQIGESRGPQLRVP